MIAANERNMSLVEAVPWERLSRKRICFGHQSVGQNLIDGLVSSGEGRLTVVESSHPETFRRPVFAHFRIGQNRDPLAKFKNFESVLMGGVGKSVDVAFFKLCYVDITAQTDERSLFETYHHMMDRLARTYPAVTFFHVTVPLRRIESGVVSWLKDKWRGNDQERIAQAKRHAYNELLRAAYGSSGRLFDLAEAEATYPDGRLSAVRYRGETIPHLVSEYTYDGGHLNEMAAERIAARLLSCIGSIEEAVSDQ